MMSRLFDNHIPCTEYFQVKFGHDSSVEVRAVKGYSHIIILALLSSPQAASCMRVLYTQFKI